AARTLYRQHLLLWLVASGSGSCSVPYRALHDPALHLLQVLAFGMFFSPSQVFGHEGALHVPWHDSRRPVLYPVGIRCTPVAQWAADCLYCDTPGAGGGRLSLGYLG